MTHDQEMILTRELGELRDTYSLTDTSEENTQRGKRIKEIMAELSLGSKPRSDRRPSRLVWK